MPLLVGDKLKIVEVEWTSTDLDMRTVDTVDLKVRLPGGGYAYWVWDITSKTLTSMIVQHMLSMSGGDLSQPGTYIIEGKVVLSDASLRDLGDVPFVVTID